MSRAKTSLGIVATVVGLSGLLAVRVLFDSTQSAPEALDLAVVGDSFAEQSEDQIRTLGAGAGLHTGVWAFGGSAICGWFDRFEQLAANPPDVLVMSFAGNDFQPCINEGGHDNVRPSEEIAADYRDQLDTVVAMFDPDETELYLVIPPPVASPVFEANAEAMRTMYRNVPADHEHVTLVDSATHLDPDSQGFQEHLPCEDWDAECDHSSGEVLVREDDGIHLTPAGGHRYARAIFAELR